MKFDRKFIYTSLAVIILLIFTIWVYPELTGLLQVNACLDEAGTWNQQQGLCEYEEN
ncbi:MAG: hypothetical protein COC24_000765 [Alphaproteobacteria bacterium]|nr:hypothetical protein [Alphaproteobacteria bacterium]